MSLKKYIQDHRSEFDDKKMSQGSGLIFEKMLKNELHPTKKGKVLFLKYFAYAACVSLLILGYYFIEDLNATKDKTVLVENLVDYSASTRLEGIYKFDDEYKVEDEQIIKILINILLEDDNSNVKIATIDALLKYPQNKEIRNTILLALEKEKEPLVQIKLIKSIGFLREHRAQTHLENLIEDIETLPIVKNNAEMAMSTFK